MAEMGLQIVEELAQVALVGFERLLRMAALVAQVRQPVARGAVQVRAKRQLGIFDGRSGHGRGSGSKRGSRFEPLWLADS